MLRSFNDNITIRFKKTNYSNIKLEWMKRQEFISFVSKD